ncbi:HEPN domain-containing protein [Micromonospora sp. NPDC049645]|uniref:HEPN domain-containing protein n=1 Tax=Micromonospora sp. NPDC049645 TaxID=3155508 RepID=UPI003420B3E9
MASNARRAFDSNSKDVEKLLDIHVQLTGTGRGRRYEVEVLNKSAIVLITSFWEAYCEDIAAEALGHLVEKCASPESLPTELRKSVAKELEAEKHDLAVWRLSGDGWRSVIRDRLALMQEERNKRLNTPKSAQIDDLFDKSLGLTRISGSWKWKGMSADQARLKLDKYVSLRGAIAHRGSASASVKKAEVTDYYQHVKELVGKTGGRINTAVKKATGESLW